MKRNSRFVFCLFLIVGMLTVMSLPLAFSQEEEEFPLAKEISGEITSVDLKNSTIVIKQLKDEESLSDETVTVYVDNSTSIEKNYEVVAIAEIKVGERITVEYATDETGKNIAVNIWIELEE